MEEALIATAAAQPYLDLSLDSSGESKWLRISSDTLELLVIRCVCVQGKALLSA